MNTGIVGWYTLYFVSKYHQKLKVSWQKVSMFRIMRKFVYLRIEIANSKRQFIEFQPLAHFLDIHCDLENIHNGDQFLIGSKPEL